jgi:hypothetical protein
MSDPSWREEAMSREYKTGLVEGHVEGPVTEAEKAKQQRDRLLAAIQKYGESPENGINSETAMDLMFEEAEEIQRELGR